MSTINDTDQFLVQRGTNSYKQSAKDLMSTIQDTDLMLVQRGTDSYKVTCQDVKDQLGGGGGGGGGIQPGPNDIGITPTPPGSGTQADPYILTTVRIGPYGATVESAEEISLTGQPFNADVIWTDNSVGAGNRFNQPQGTTTATGTWTGRLQYADVPASTADTNYTGDLQLGALYFRWTVEQVENADLPTSIQSVSLVENNPAAEPRFTDQSFTLTTSITDGVPKAEKTIDAYVEGTIKTRAETDTIASSTNAGVGSAQVFATPGGANDRTERSPVYQNGVYFCSAGTNNVGNVYASQDPTFATTDSYNNHIACCKVSDYAVAVIGESGQIKVISCLNWDDWLTHTVIAEGDTNSNLSKDKWSNIRGLQYAMYPGGGDESQRGRAGFVVEYSSPVNNNTPVYAIRFHPELKQFDPNWMTATGPSSNVGMRTVACDQKSAYVWAFSGNASGGIKVWRARFPNGLPTTGTNLNFQDIGNQGITPNTSAGNPYAIDSIWCKENDTVYVAISDGQFYAAAPGASTTGFLSAGTFTPQNESNALCNIGTCNGDIFLVREQGDYQIRRYTSQTAYTTLASGNPGGGFYTQGRRAMKEAPNFVQVSNPNGLFITPQTSTITFNSSQNFDKLAVGEEVIQLPTALDRTGVTIRSIDAANNQIETSVANGWTVGEKVYGPEKVVANTKKYLDFDSSGNVTDLLSSPQSPAYKTTDTNPGLTLKFPSTFPSGNAPDDELADGTTLTVEVTSTNATSSDGPVQKTVQPAKNATTGVYADDVFSTYLYKGNGTTQTLITGIDLAGEGGLVWMKARTGTNNDHTLCDSERTDGFTKGLNTNSPGTGIGAAGAFTSFNSDGHSLETASYINDNGEDYVNWTFRKSPGFFDCVKYNGNGGVRNVPHALGTKPGCIMVKNLTDATDWQVYHRSEGAGKFLTLNENFTSQNTNVWDNTEPNADEFTVGNSNAVSGAGKEYIAYLFADDAKQFGKNGDEALIRCGSFTTDSNGLFDVNLGFEPQWLLYKRTDASGDWAVLDIQRDWTVRSLSRLRPNLSDAEFQNQGEGYFQPYQEGFKSTSAFFGSNRDYIYVAIRRPHKPPALPSQVFKAVSAANEPVTTELTSSYGMAPDLVIHRVNRSTNGMLAWATRLQGSNKYLVSNYLSDAEREFANYWQFDNSEYAYIPAGGYYNNTSSRSYFVHSFKRAPGVLDIVTWKGNGNVQAIKHSLTVPPELVITKSRTGTTWWYTYADGLGTSSYLVLNKDEGLSTNNSSIWNDTAPTADEFTVGSSSANNSGEDYIGFMFASLPGVSKIGTYDGTGNRIEIDCGFTNGAALIWIKRTDGSPVSGNGNWYVFDSNRGITGAFDTPYVTLNATDAEVDAPNDSVGPYNAGFRVGAGSPANINAAGGKYLYLAIAKDPIRSMTQDEFAQEAASFATYENRAAVHQGELAMAKRDALKKDLEAAGVDPPAIDKLLGGTSS